MNKEFKIYLKCVAGTFLALLVTSLAIRRCYFHTLSLEDLKQCSLIDFWFSFIFGFLPYVFVSVLLIQRFMKTAKYRAVIFWFHLYPNLTQLNQLKQNFFNDEAEAKKWAVQTATRYDKSGYIPSEYGIAWQVHPNPYKKELDNKSNSATLAS